MMKKLFLLLPLLGVVGTVRATDAVDAEKWKGYAWHFVGTSAVMGGDGEKIVNGEIWRDSRTASVTGRTWKVEIVGGPSTNETNTVVFSSSCTLPPAEIAADSDLRFELAASCTGACTARCDRVFVKWNSDNNKDPRPEEAFQLVGGGQLPGVSTNGIFLSAAEGGARKVAGVYSKKVPFGRRSGGKVTIAFFGSGSLTKWTYVWQQDEKAKAQERRAKQIARALDGATEFKAAIAALNAKQPAVWEAFDLVLPEEDGTEAGFDYDGPVAQQSSFFGRLLKWTFWLSFLVLAADFTWKNYATLRQFRSARESRWGRVGECALHVCRLFWLYLLDLVKRGIAYLRKMRNKRKN